MNLELPVTYYCAVPSRNPRGRVTETWTLDMARTALIELHCWNFGFPGEPPVPEEYWVFMGSPQNHDRMLPIVTEVIAPLLDAGRRAGMPIVHVQPESVAARYSEVGLPGATAPAKWHAKPLRGHTSCAHQAAARPHDFRASSARSSRASAASLRPIRRHLGNTHGRPASERSDLHRASKVHGEGYMAWDGWQKLDVAPPVRPRAGDAMIVTTEGFDAWLRERGITTLLYTGFATNLCILDSPAAMKAMRGLGYRCVIVREATMAVEFPDTLETLAHTRAALQYIEVWVGYSTGVADLMRAYSTIGRQ